MARLLKQMGIPIAGRLLELAGSGGLKKRNQSILAHGFRAEALPEDLLRRRYKDLEKVLLECDGNSRWAELLGSICNNRCDRS